MIISEFNRIKWHCRRGTLELDLLFNSFVDKHILQLSEQQLQCFKELLEQDNLQLELWLIKDQQSIPQKYQEICKLILKNAVV